MRNVPEFPFANASGGRSVGRKEGDLVVVDGGRGAVSKVVVRSYAMSTAPPIIGCTVIHTDIDCVASRRYMRSGVHTLRNGVQ